MDMLKLGFDAERRALDIEGRKSPADAVEAEDPDGDSPIRELFDDLGNGPEVLDLMWRFRAIFIEIGELKRKAEIRNQEAKASSVR